MTRCFVTKHVSHLLCVVVLLYLLGAVPGELSARIELVPGVTGDPASRTRDSAAIAETIAKIRPARMRSS
jgi:hypothetical protein